MDITNDSRYMVEIFNYLSLCRARDITRKEFVLRNISIYGDGSGHILVDGKTVRYFSNLEYAAALLRSLWEKGYMP